MEKNEFDLEMKIIEERKKLQDSIHEQKMEELQFIRKTEMLKCEWQKEVMRIKSAEIRKTQERKARFKEF